MKLKLKHAIRHWVTSLFGVLLLAIVIYKTYYMFETITYAQAGIVILFSTFGISLIFAKDSFIKDIRKALLNKYLNK